MTIQAGGPFFTLAMLEDRQTQSEMSRHAYRIETRRALHYCLYAEELAIRKAKEEEARRKSRIIFCSRRSALAIWPAEQIARGLCVITHHPQKSYCQFERFVVDIISVLRVLSTKSLLEVYSTIRAEEGENPRRSMAEV
ncbi:hypothetical protein I307_02351 [Cryptococcus deuterogattii 99/473]|uniref:Uncharacterized protein n=1 Tax=Cryptococcus deuterogattii Ram5 TaxID=1296110 RepID=A0A0D0TRY4_9TREE|nr:hypothetical protein I309_01992 [Cryptococcus deuterogattii LA55]KIR34858.1 hypothetical protein I352_03111 [Cryptococcus deuterogattii MMRL2647]KIR38318.1 hypothetical protein I313_05892 [Cryptococcus deuterogattii Ram5]KIR73544.1 hypothetical protein I310_02215 [Cryptococcus deuterogattii CA1014]KIR93033.1 hypothetical protein I304_02695 [Cryptococcus deuterogattii CBS 10090]KIR99703.1 hypothetical protein L804_03336 [Cryptococcus deuterogattii 2001/935-1]KIY58104.1 hypothetical protein 